MKKRATWVNGVLDGGVPGDDLGLLRGLTVFDTWRTYGDHPFRLTQHLERFEASAAEMSIALPSREEICAEVARASASFPKGADLQIRFTVTGGGARIVDVQILDEARIWGEVKVGKLRWDPPEWLPGVVKHGSRASWVLAAQRQHADEVLLVDSGGFILEANRSNVFAVIDGVVRTPPLDRRCLEGVTRGALVEAAIRSGIPIDQSPLPFESPFDELYLSSTLKELAPVVEVCGQPITGAGPVGRALLDAFRALVRSEIQSRPSP